MQKTKELHSVWKKFSKSRDEDSRNVLVEYYYTHLVRKIASNLSAKFYYKIPVDELASHGVTGLYRALDGFDEERGVKFETYAFSRIWGSILDGLRKEDRVPRSVRIRQSRIEKIKSEMEIELGYVDENTAIKQAGFDPKEYHKNLSKFKASHFSSIETNTNDIDNDDNKKDFNKNLISQCEPTADSTLVRKEFLGKLIGRNFSQIERRIIYYYYYQELSMREISALLKISESKVSQMHRSILKRLKTRIKVNPKYFGMDVAIFIKECNDKDNLV
jgi:RNA polymerase sigma factor for flagellar operon FliA